jgi:hypothetical protein
MPYKDGGKSGGRKPGSKNKLTLAKARIREAAMAKIGAAHSDAFKGEPLDFIEAIMRSPDFDPDMRFEAATRAAQYRHAKKSENVIEDKTNYVTRMPHPVKDLDEWKRMHMQTESPQEDPAWTEGWRRSPRMPKGKHANE